MAGVAAAEREDAVWGEWHGVALGSIYVAELESASDAESESADPV